MDLDQDLEYKIMKKYITLILLLVTMSSYSQVDSTKVWEARQEWLSNQDNYSQGQQMPVWDVDGNVVSFTLILLLSVIYYKRKVKLNVQ